MALDQKQQPLAGSIQLIKLAGISVNVHWTWLLVAFFELQYRSGIYGERYWNAIEYLALFAIVTLHEFGHSLACRQVGGKADRIVLWPLGGIAFVSPPPRPGAWLWSIAAGPLVNLILVPLTFAVVVFADYQDWPESNLDAYYFVQILAQMNLVLLVFNMLPIYPLDGGQILQSLLWFVIGRAKSLLVVSVIGLMAASVGAILAVFVGELWWVIIAVFIGLRSLAGFREARMLASTVNPIQDPFALGVPIDSDSQPDATPRLRTSTPADPPTVHAHCEKCGKSSLFPAAQRGTVQTCPICRASVDVGPIEDDGDWWKGEDGEPSEDRK
jgi:Zn-dependent protease